MKKGFPDGSDVKKLPAMQEMQVQSLGQEDPMEKEMASPLQYSCLGIPRTEKPGSLCTVHGVSKELDTIQQLNTNNLPPKVL